MAEEDCQFDNDNAKPNGGEGKRRKKKAVKECSEIEEDVRFQAKTSWKDEASRESESVKRKKRKRSLKEDDDEGKKVDVVEEEKKNVKNPKDENEGKKMKRSKEKKKGSQPRSRGICYLSRIPPHMDPFNLRQILSQFGEIDRIYLTPRNAAAKVRRKPVGRRQDQTFSEGWVEFVDKRVAKRVANMLNGEQIGGKKRSSFYYDLWNIKYLSKFKWDNLTEEIAYKHAVREQKLALENSAAKREKDFYLSKVDKARALSSIEERLKKKQKLQEESGTNADIPVIQQATKVFRKFPQKKPVAHEAGEAKPRLSKDILAGVFGGSQ